jgi:hypothetical protein
MVKTSYDLKPMPLRHARYSAFVCVRPERIMALSLRGRPPSGGWLRAR